MAKIKIDKVVSVLPTPLVANTIYAVRNGTGFDLYFTDTTGSTAHSLNMSGGGVSLSDTENIAAGSTLGLQQSLLAEAGQPGLTVLVAGPATNGKVQGVSLGDGNVIEVFADGAAYTNGTVLYREFMSLGEPICFTGLSFGAVIVASKGFYGITEIEGKSQNELNQAIMPLLSYGLSFKNTFLYAFRNSTGANNARGIVFVANGPLNNNIKLTTGTGTTVRGQENISLTPWQTTYLDCDGNQEYILEGTNPMMACVISNGGGTAVNGATRPSSGLNNLSNGTIWDARLVLPVSADIIGNPRNSFISAPYSGTTAKWYDVEGHSGNLNNGNGFGPGNPIDGKANTPIGTGNNQGDHNPAGYTRIKATGLITSHSGADGQGGDAVAFFDVSSMSQVVAQPLRIPDSGQGDEAGITICSPYTGTAKIYEWNTATNSLDLKYTLNLTRTNTVTTRNDQNHPCAATLSNTTGNLNNTILNGELKPGVIIADVPIGVVIQAKNGVVSNMRSQNGTTTASIYTQEDETGMYGWTPSELRAEIKEGTDGLLYKKVITSTLATYEKV